MFGIGPMELLLVSVSVVAGATGMPLSIPPMPPDATIRRAVPEECVLLALAAGTGTPDAKSANQTEQLLAEPEVQEFFTGVREQFASIVQQAVERNPQMEPLARFGSPLAGVLLTRPAVFYVSHLAVAPGGMPDVRAALLVHCGDRKADVKKLITELEPLMAQAGPPFDVVTDVKVSGTALRRLQNCPLESTWGFSGDYFLLTVGTGASEELLERIGSKGETAAWFTAAEKQANIERLSTLAYFNAAKALEIGLPLIPDPQAKTALEALGLTKVKAAIAAVGLNKTGIASRMMINLDGEPKGLFELVAAKPLTAEDLRIVPRNATMALVQRFNLAAVYRRVLEIVGQIEPRAVEELKGNLSGVEQSLGFQLERDVLNSLGDLWTFHDASSGGMPFSGMVVTVSLRDKAKLKEIEDRILALLKAQEDRLGFKIKATKMGEASGYQVVPKAIMPFAPAWCLMEDRLLVGGTAQALRGQIARDPKSATLADVPQIAARLKSDGGPSVISYQDTQAGLRGMYGMVQSFGPMAVSGLAQQGIDFEIPALPSLETIDPHVVPAIGSVRRTKQGILYERVETVPVMGGGGTATTGVLVALLLPAVQAAREAARRNQSSNNLKYQALAMHNYLDRNKHFPPAAITDKAGKPLLSWRVAILPYIEEQALYEQFHLDEPWDSEHNRPLADRMPVVFMNPNIGSGNKTNYLVPSGPKTMFADSKGIGIRQITDGTSKTVMIVEANPDDAVEWSKPEDLKVNAKQPTAGVDKARPGVFMAAFADGSVHAIPLDIDPQTLKALFTPAGREAVNTDGF